jgi:cephalosporin hydroxylase
VPTWQHPFDLWITQEIITEVAPDLVVECGSNCGGSALLWTMLLEQINPAAKVITIDIEDRIDAARKLALFRRKVEFIRGSSIDPEVIARVAKRAKGKRTLVILDSDHKCEHVAAELSGYAPMVSPGSYLICQDGCINGHPLEPDFGPGPLEAIQAFLADHHDFEVDRSRERMLFTFNPSGFLRRKG